MAMKKRYKAYKCIHMNVRLRSGKYLHVSFSSHSNGSSTYSTDNKDVIEALENHVWYNKLFMLDAIIEDKVEEKVEKKEESQKAKEIQVIKVADMGEAKEYLASTFGIARTSLRGVQAIKDQAKAYGIEFEGL
mgnify:CR=1 FL=1